MTNGKFVSRVVNTLRYLTKDEHISRRFVLHVGKQVRAFIIARDLERRNLFRDSSIVKWIDCHELEKASKNYCGVVLKCDVDTMVSKNKLPLLHTSKHLDSLLYVQTIGGKDISRVYAAPSKHNKRVFELKEPTYLFKDGKIHLFNAEYKKLKIGFIPADDVICSECDDSVDDCTSLWDIEFSMPDKYIEPIFNETLRQISIQKGITPDELPNLDENQRSR